MQVSHVPCPHCSTNLRIRDRALIGKRIDCPDCGRRIEIVADGAKHLAARLPVEEGSAPKSPTSGKKRRRKSTTRKPSTQRHSESKSRNAAEAEARVPIGRRVLNVLKNPVVVSWIVAVIATGTIVGVVLSRAAERDANVTVSNDESLIDGDPTIDNGGEQQPINIWDVDGAATQERLRRIGRLIAEHEQQRGSYPRGTVPGDGLPPENRLSWISRLAAKSKRYGRLQPDWNRAWRDPVNEPFARQQLDLFRNPNLPGQPGPDGLPVTHFVGVAGVGADGPTLPAEHPRAGIFAYNRATKRTDIRDGLGNTMMIAGVNQHVGGWAVGGRSTIRPFVKEPYVNGPDGFGTGQKDSMLVLMADGSVRTITRKTSPVIVRRMAAMADGFPLDPGVPGDPLKSRVKPPPVVKKKERPTKPPVVAVKPKRKPIDANRINVAAALSQKVLRFENPGKATRRMLIAEVEELAGVPIRVDRNLTPALAALLDERVAVKLKDATAKDILDAILKETGLKAAIEERGVRIVAAGKTR